MNHRGRPARPGGAHARLSTRRRTVSPHATSRDQQLPPAQSVMAGTYPAPSRSTGADMRTERVLSCIVCLIRYSLLPEARFAHGQRRLGNNEHGHTARLARRGLARLARPARQVPRRHGRLPAGTAELEARQKLQQRHRQAGQVKRAPRGQGTTWPLRPTWARWPSRHGRRDRVGMAAPHGRNGHTTRPE